MRSRALAIIAALLLIAPVAAAWQTPRVTPILGTRLAADWALPWAHYAAKPHGKAPTKTNAACLVGDANHDGKPDLLLRIHNKQTGELILRLFAGPDFKHVIWSKQKKEGTTLRCAADAQGDGTHDPIVETRGNQTSPIPGLPATLPIEADEELDTTEALDGTSGEPLVHVDDTTTTQGASPLEPAGASHEQTGNLTPGAPDVYLHVSTESSGSSTPTIPALGTPVSGEHDTTKVEILDERGQPRGTIEAPTPNAEIHAVATSSNATDTHILVLSSADPTPLDQAHAQVPSLTAYTPEGQVAWTQQQPATTDVPLLVPRAGDVNGDGTPDIIVETAQPTLGGSGTGSAEVLSGKDGSVLLAKTNPSGDILALPLGDLTPPPTSEITQNAAPSTTSGDAILTLAQAADGSVHVDAIEGGKTAWTATLPPGSAPANPILDAYTGDITGFSDLTGDRVPDLAVTSPTSAGTQLTVLDGTNGTTRWTDMLPVATSVTRLPTPMGGDDLLATTNPPQGTTLTLTRLDGATGATQWTSTGQKPNGPASVDVDTQDAAKNDTVIVTVTPNNPTNDTSSIYVVDPNTGNSTWTAPTDPTQPPPPPLESTSAAPPQTPPAGFARWILVIVATAVLVAVFLIVLARRRKRDDEP